MTTFRDHIQGLTDELAELLILKNAAYGDSFHKQFQKYGMASALIRMDDKMSRLENLHNLGQLEANGESIRDTLMDLAGYALLAVLELEDG